MDLITGLLKGASLVLMMMFVSPLCPVTSRVVVAARVVLMTGSGWIIQYPCNFNPALSPQIAWCPLLVVGPIIPRLPRTDIFESILHKNPFYLYSISH